jgi:two-component system sensor kinase FixL
MAGSDSAMPRDALPFPSSAASSPPSRSRLLEHARRYFAHPAAISLLYVAAGLLWLPGKDLLAWFGGAASLSLPELLKDVSAIAASGGLLYWLLRTRANATARDIAARRQAEENLRRARDELETRVQERTAALLDINRALERQIAARVQAECALRDSEERFRQLAEHIREVFWVYGINEERLLYVSPAYEDIWGRSVRNFHDRPLDWIEAIHPDDRPRVREAHANKLETGHLSEEYRIVRPDGAIRWIWDRGFPISDEAGHVYRIAGLAEDITARKLAEDQLRRQQVELARMSRLSLAVELASNLAHDLNQPLAAIVAYTQACLALLRQDRTDPRELTGTLEEVVNQGMRAGGIIRHLRELVHKHPAPQTALDLNALIHAVVHYAQLELRQAAVALKLELAEGLPAILADDFQIQLVVLYLMRNAIEAMHEAAEGPRQLIVRTIPGDEDTVRVTLSDSGPGLSPEAAERLFQPFFSTKPGGMGLGLSVSRSIIESQGGRLWATPNPDRGVSFHFTLPAHANPPSPPPRP